MALPLISKKLESSLCLYNVSSDSDGSDNIAVFFNSYVNSFI